MRNLIQLLIVVCLMLCPVQSVQALCTKTTSITELLKTSKAGEQAFADMNLEKLLVHSTSVRDDILPCLSDKITPLSAAAFHRLMALEAFAKNRKDRVVVEFHAARKLDPGYKIPQDVAGEGHPLKKLYEQALTSPDGKLEVIYPPKGGYITVGGVRAAPRPSMTPVIVQVFGPLDVLKETRYLQPGETLPVWGPNPKTVGADVVLQPSVLTQPKTWYYTAAALLATAGGLYGAAMYNKSKFNDTSHPDTVESDKALSGYRDNTNLFGGLSILAGGLAIVSTGVGAGFHFSTGDEKSLAKVRRND